MVRFHYWILMMVLVGLVACSAGSDDSTARQEQLAGQDYPEGSWRTRYLELGRETYEKVCATCHDANENGAPVKGDRDSWSERSPLWSAVLLKHAKSGYLDMPTKGGQIELSDRAVEAAGEYMLSETFPELPRD